MKSKNLKVKYYKILKDEKLIGLGKTDTSQLPIDNTVFKFVEITEKQYEKLNKEEYESLT